MLIACSASGIDPIAIGDTHGWVQTYSGNSSGIHIGFMIFELRRSRT
jgi:hypothetical protein